jgi:hypothetical protein
MQYSLSLRKVEYVTALVTAKSKVAGRRHIAHDKGATIVVLTVTLYRALLPVLA